MTPSHGQKGISRHRISVAPPYRLDLTVTALRRLPTNIVDLLTSDGQYARALDGAKGPVIVHVRQTRPDLLTVRLEGAAADRRQVLPIVRRILGVDRDLEPFYDAARHVPWLRPLVRRMRGVRPPRYPTLWEASVKVVLFQQISLQAASTITTRLTTALGTPLEGTGDRLYTFPSAARVLDTTDTVLRSFGISPNKLAALRRVGEALESGDLDEAKLEELPSPEVASVLQEIKGIGPWSATVILLRGFGRLDVFPLNDSSVKHNLKVVTGGTVIDLPRVLEQLGPQRGMLYYHLLLARLEGLGEAGSPSRTGEKAGVRHEGGK
jgi:DNA-3-methyladenine glycosylase II